MEYMNAKDRAFILKEKPGQKARGTTGLVDPRLFKGGNKIHAYQDASTCLWYLKYEVGGLPEGLKDMRWTSYRLVEDHLRKYFDKRGLLLEAVEEDAESSNAFGL